MLIGADYHALVAEGYETTEAVVTDGDLIQLAATANAKHGRALTLNERNRAILVLIEEGFNG